MHSVWCSASSTRCSFSCVLSKTVGNSSSFDRVVLTLPSRAGGAGPSPNLPRSSEPPIHLQHYNHEGLKPRARRWSVFTDVSLNVSVASLIIIIFSLSLSIREATLRANFGSFSADNNTSFVCVIKLPVTTHVGVFWFVWLLVQFASKLMCAAHKIKANFFKSLCANFVLHYCFFL